LTRLEIETMGLWLADLLSDSQLAAAVERYNAKIALNKQFLVPLAGLRLVWMNHFHRVIRMPAGGAQAGGSMQTGFEMELVTRLAVEALMEGWPNRQEMARGGLSWEVRTMEELGPLLAFEKKPAGWGMLNCKPIAPLPRTQEHRGVLMVSPPLTVTWSVRADSSTLLAVRFPLTIWSDDDAMILPPDDAAGNSFYADPADQPGFHRDIFKTWAHMLLGELHSALVPMTLRALAHLPRQYQGCDSPCESEEDQRSRSDEAEARPEILDSSDEAEARPEILDSSDEEGAHREMIDSSDEEGAHL
jgi:hypothetical protein